MRFNLIVTLDGVPKTPSTGVFGRPQEPPCYPLDSMVVLKTVCTSARQVLLVFTVTRLNPSRNSKNKRFCALIAMSSSLSVSLQPVTLLPHQDSSAKPTGCCGAETGAQFCLIICCVVTLWAHTGQLGSWGSVRPTRSEIPGS